MSNSKAPKIIAILMALVIFVFLIKNPTYGLVEQISAFLRQDDLSQEDSITFDKVESDYAAGIWHHADFLNLNGSVAKTLGMRGLYSGMGMYVADGNYIVSSYRQTSTDYEVGQLLDFSEFLKEQGIQLLYVNQPAKYLDDSFFAQQFGVETYSNRNADLFMERIREAGIPAIDLREAIKRDGLDISHMFYRTDHHWTTESALWATREIAQAMDDYCGYTIDPELYNVDNFQFTSYEACWLGEQGRKMAKTYVGLDNFTEIKPNFATSYTFKTEKGNVAGTFDDFVDESKYDLDADVYETTSWHYSYRQRNCMNNNVDQGKVLLLGDSYAQATEPFLSLSVHEIDSLILRSCDKDFDLHQYIIENGYDTVVICYAQFMIGAHDNPESANYKMFSFNGQ